MKSATIKIITNNPLVFDKYKNITFLQSCSVEDIFTLARDEIHLGAKLIIHPLSGSIKPNESPYKSLVLSNERDSLDTESLLLIESAIATLRKLPKRSRELPKRALDDFQVIDLDLLDSAITALPQNYYF